MSGIEVAGLILGALPLIIAALENYSGGLEATVAFFRWKGQLTAALQSLWYQQTSYELSIRLLLDPITTERELELMLADSCNALWQSKEMSTALQRRLGDAYMGYMETIKSMELATKLIAEKLDINGSDKITQRGLAALILANPPLTKNNSTQFKFQRRVNFTMSRKTVKKLLAELEICNRRLDSYATKAERLEQPYRARRAAKFSIPLCLIEEDVTRIYHTISRTWCTNHSMHQAGLLLEQRLVQKQSTGKRKPVNIMAFDDRRCFGVSLFRPVAPVRWLDTEFHVIEPQTTASQSTRKAVRIVTPSPSVPASKSLNNSLQPSYDLSRLPRVTDLCAAIQHPSHVWLGFCLDTNGTLRGSYPAPPQSAAAENSVISLAGMLDRRYSLSKEDIYSLSVTLSSSLLQLSQTPWLCQSWTKSNILFLRVKNSSDQNIDFKHPYLTKEYKTGVVIEHSETWRRNDSSNVLALAILLVEILSGQSIESLCLPQDLGVGQRPNDFTDLQVVQRWITKEEESGNLTLAFQSAISHCLKCYVGSPLNLADATARAGIEEHVLSPLQEEMSFLFG